MKSTATAVLTLLPLTTFALTSTTYTANFTVNVNNGQLPPDFSKPYEGLFYSGFDKAPYDYQSGACAYVCPHSFPNPVGFTANPGAQGNISAKYDGSKVKYFELSDFYYGCNAYLDAKQPNGQPLTYETPANCTVHVAAYTSSSKPAVAKQIFQYQPNITPNRNTGAPSAPMAHGVFSKAFQATGIRFVRFTAEGPKEGYVGNEGPYKQSVPDLLIDDFTYTVFES